MRNSLCAGNNVTLPAPYALTSGQLAQGGAIIGVAQAAAAAAADVVLVRQGVFSLTKATGQAWALGATLFWDNAAWNVTTTVATNEMTGAAFAAALTADTTGSVLLDGTIRV